MRASVILTRAQAERLLETFGSDFYVYHLVGPDGLPFYVGQGQGHRVFDHERERYIPNAFAKRDLIKTARESSNGLRYRLIGPLRTQSEAHKVEVAQISRWKRRLHGGVLTNLTDGGAGGAGALSGSPNAYGARGIGNRFILQLIQAGSIPVRPVAVYTPSTSAKPRVRRALTARQAAALAASAIANNIPLEGACEVPRRMLIDEVEFIIEDAVTKSILENESASLVPGKPKGYEVFRLSAGQAQAVRALINNGQFESVAACGERKSKKPA